MKFYFSVNLFDETASLTISLTLTLTTITSLSLVWY